jgi:hypothetical protein
MEGSNGLGRVWNCPRRLEKGVLDEGKTLRLKNGPPMGWQKLEGHVSIYVFSLARTYCVSARFDCNDTIV